MAFYTAVNLPTREMVSTSVLPELAVWGVRLPPLYSPGGGVGMAIKTEPLLGDQEGMFPKIGAGRGWLRGCAPVEPRALEKISGTRTAA